MEFVYNPRAIGYHDHLKDFPRFCVDMETAGESLIRVYRQYPEIKVPKKIDILEDPIGKLSGKKKLIKIIMTLTLRFPWVLIIPRGTLYLSGSPFALRHLLFPLYRWVSHYHYALGMQRALDRR